MTSPTESPDHAPDALVVEPTVTPVDAKETRERILAALEGGGVRVELGDGAPNPIALQLLLAARASAGAGRPIRFGPRAAAALDHL